MNSTRPEVAGATVAVSVTGLPITAFALTVSVVVVVVWANAIMGAAAAINSPLGIGLTQLSATFHICQSRIVRILDLYGTSFTHHKQAALGAPPEHLDVSELRKNSHKPVHTLVEVR